MGPAWADGIAARRTAAHAANAATLRCAARRHLTTVAVIVSPFRGNLRCDFLVRPGPHRHRRGVDARPAILPDIPGQTRTGCRALNELEIDELVGRFGADLRRLRIEAGEPAFRNLAHSTG